MILRRYGTSFQSVALNFDAKALTEIGFRRDHARSHPAEEFLAAHERVGGHELAASADGHVQEEVERALLADLEAQVRAAEAALGEGELLVVESEQGSDYPKTRTQQKTVVVGGENRLHFTTVVDPPLRLGVYRASGGGGGA